MRWRRQLRPARREQDELGDARQRAAAAQARAVARLEQAERRLAQLGAELAGAELATEESALVERGAALQRELAVAEHRLEQLQAQQPAGSLAELEQRIALLQEAAERRAGLLREREIACERLKERVAVLAGGGLDERLAGARRRLDELERECAGYRREVEALACCGASCARPSATPRSATPSRSCERLRPYLQALFPAADLALDDAPADHRGRPRRRQRAVRAAERRHARADRGADPARLRRAARRPGPAGDGRARRRAGVLRRPADRADVRDPGRRRARSSRSSC